VRRVAAALVFAAAVGTRSAEADPGPAPSVPPPSTSSAQTAPPAGATPAAAVPRGLAVVALAGATDAAWPLAQAVYADVQLRPPDIDEAHARALCGEAGPQGPQEAREVKELAEMVAAVKGDDAASTTMLREIARRMRVKAVAVVRADGPRPTARVFLPETGAFDAATYGPDDAGTTGATAATPSVAWSSAVRSLDRSFGSEGPGGTGPQRAPALASHEGPRIEGGTAPGKHFYESGWFWGALGAAAFTGGAIFLATRDTGASTIHLEMQVPH